MMLYLYDWTPQPSGGFERVNLFTTNPSNGTIFLRYTQALLPEFKFLTVLE